MNVKAKTRTLPRKMRLHLLISQRWQKHQKSWRRAYHQKKLKSAPNPPTQLTSCGQVPSANRASMAAADSSTPSSCSSALLELRELFLTNQPTMSKNSAPWQQLGAKRLNRAMDHLHTVATWAWVAQPGHLLQGSVELQVWRLVGEGNLITSPVVPATPKGSGVTSSSFFCSHRGLPPWREVRSLSGQTRSAGQASSETTAAWAQP